MIKFNYLSLLLQIRYYFLAALQTWQPWYHWHGSPSRWSISGHRGRSPIGISVMAALRQLWEPHPLVLLLRGSAQAAGCSHSPHTPWGCTLGLSARQDIPRPLSSRWKRIPLANVTKHQMCRRGTRLLLQNKPTSVIHNGSAVAHSSPALNGSTKHPPHPVLLPSWLSGSPRLFPSLPLSAKVFTPGPCSSCGADASLWAVPLGYPLIYRLLGPRLFTEQSQCGDANADNPLQPFLWDPSCLSSLS